MGGAELACERKALLMNVDGDKGGASRDLGGHQPGQADRANSEHCKRIAGLRPHGVEHRASAGLPAARERPDQFERRVPSELDRKALVGNRIGRK